MKLTSLKQTPKDLKKIEESYKAGPEADSFPYGTCISLRPEELKKMGFTLQNLLKPGTKVTISAEGYVKSANVELGDNDDDSPRMEIQITELGLEEEPKSKKKRVENEHLAAITKKS